MAPAPKLQIDAESGLVRVNVARLRDQMLQEYKASKEKQGQAKMPPSPEKETKKLKVYRPPAASGMTPHEEGEEEEEDQDAPEQITREILIGCWEDVAGNNVMVQQTDANGEELTAKMMSATNEVILQFSIWQESNGGKWHCGDCVLNVDRSSAEQLAWEFPNGRVAMWTWKYYTLESLEVRGIALPQNRPVWSSKGNFTACVPILVPLGHHSAALVPY